MTEYSMNNDEVKKVTEGVEAFAFDYDGCFGYRLDGTDLKGWLKADLNGTIKSNFVSVFNHYAKSEKGEAFVARVRELAESSDETKGKVKDYSNITGADFGATFVSGFRAMKEIMPEKLNAFNKGVFALRYYKIKQNPELVKALDESIENKVPIYIYSNGTTSNFGMDTSHVAKAMHKQGFADSTIDYMMKNRMFGLKESVENGRGKPTVQGFKDFFKAKNIDPEKLLFADDSPDNVLAAKKAGAKAAVLTWTSDKEIPEATMQKLAAAGIPIVGDTTKFVQQIVAIKKEEPKPQVKRKANISLGV